MPLTHLEHASAERVEVLGLPAELKLVHLPLAAIAEDDYIGELARVEEAMAEVSVACANRHWKSSCRLLGCADAAKGSASTSLIERLRFACGSDIVSAYKDRKSEAGGHEIDEGIQKFCLCG